MPFIVSVDRRTGQAPRVRQELESLASSIEAMAFDPVDPGPLPDAGRFRDFVPLGSFHHPDPAVSEWIVRELVDLFGWTVDVRPTTLTSVAESASPPTTVGERIPPDGPGEPSSD